MTKKSDYTKIEELGEFGLIALLTQEIQLQHEASEKGIGDDAAVLDFGVRKCLISTDLLVEGVHFDMAYMPLKHLGYKSIVVNLSDIAAMNAHPTQVTISLAISSKYSLEAVQEIYEGMKLACKKYKVDIVGGDTTSSQSGLCISITVLGSAEKDQITYRSGAGVHDLICVTGDLGAAYAGLLVLEREKTVFLANPGAQPDLSGHDYVIGRQLKPEPRLDIVDLLKEMGILPTSMIDISDGLASELLHICSESRCGCAIYEEKIPIDEAAFSLLEEFNIVPHTAALNGGEDYELLFTVKQTDFEKVKLIPGLSVIGHITDESEGAAMITRTGSVIELKAQGWDALRKRDNI
ncbi:MAG: thiamine-phosphate kinase [Bacteroidetes bacterium]|nr:thiamine-phosphate kinase [Bacteroidota bacterium]MBU1720039.1 thiamine-phosphate kinase [Bacteroidota bacterium]